MSTTRDVDFGGVSVRGAWHSASGPEPVAELAVYTKTGQARIASLSERDLLELITASAEALVRLRTYRERVAAEHVRHCVAPTCCRQPSLTLSPLSDFGNDPSL